MMTGSHVQKKEKVKRRVEELQRVLVSQVHREFFVGVLSLWEVKPTSRDSKRCFLEYNHNG